MPLEKQTVSFPLAKGMDEKSSDKTRGHDTLEDCLNARMAKNGEIYKRGGFVTQGNTKTAGGTIGKGIAIAQYKDETLVFDQSRMYSKDSSSTFLDKGQFVPCEFRNMPVRRELDRRQGNAHFAEVNNLDVYVWVECMFNDNKYRVMVTARDKGTGATVLSPTKIMEQSAGTSGANVLYQIPRPQCIGVGNYAFILWNEHDGSSAYNNIKYASVNCTSLATASAVSSPAILVDGSAAAVQLSDVRPVFAIDHAANAHVGDGIIMAFHPDGASLAWRIQYATASGATLTAGDKIDILESAHASIFYPWTKGGHPVANEIMLKALNDNTDSATDRQIVFAANVDDGGGNPDVLVWIIYANLSGLQVRTVATGLNDYYLIGGTCGTTSDGNDTIHLALELWDPAKTGATNVRVVEHRIKRFNFTRSSAALAQQNDVVAFNSSITSDMVRQDSRLYYTVTHVNSNTLVREDGQQNSSNCIVLDQSDTMVAALPAGRSATCLTSEYVQRDPVTDTGGSGDIRRLLYGIQRVVTTGTSVHSFGASRFYGIAGEEAGAFSFSDYANNIFSISKIEMNFDQVRKFTSVDVDGSLVFTGGFLHGYDGEKIFENGFVVFPSIRTVSQGAAGLAGASGVLSGTYYYTAVYEWADSNGVIHRSAPARKEKFVVDGSALSSGDNPIVTVDVYVPNFTLKGDVLVRLYRTEAGPGAVFYEVTNKRIASPATASYVSIVDRPSDNTAATITAQPPIYTQTELSNDFFGSCNDLVRHKDYLFAVASDDSVRYSKPLEDGTEARFPDAFTLSFPGESSRTAGIETNLDHLCIFTEDNGFFISGQGPTSAGQGDFTAPRLFAAGQGMVNGAPHVNSPVGNFIVTDRGIYLIGRDLSVKYIGAQVEDIDAYPKLNMLCHDATNEIRIMLTQPGQATGTDDYLIYNYYFGQWTRWGITYTSSARHVAEIYDGTDFVRLTADGKTQKQSAAVFQDNNTGSSLSYNFGFTTTSIAPGGLLQAHRIYRFLLLGDYISDHTTTVKAYYDYSPSVTTTFTKSVTSANDAPMLLRAHLDKQKCRAVKFEVALSGAGQCATLDAVALEAGRRPTTFKPQTSRSERTM